MSFAELQCPNLTIENSTSVNNLAGEYLTSIDVSCITGHYAYQGQVNQQSSYTTVCQHDATWSITEHCQSKIGIFPPTSLYTGRNPWNLQGIQCLRYLGYTHIS